MPCPAHGAVSRMFSMTHVHSKKQASQGEHKQALQKNIQENLQSPGLQPVVELNRALIRRLGLLMVGNNTMSISKMCSKPNKWLACQYLDSMLPSSLMIVRIMTTS